MDNFTLTTTILADTKDAIDELHMYRMYRMYFALKCEARKLGLTIPGLLNFAIKSLESRAAMEGR